ncbi:Ser/Thr protein kinase RdoA (MazF antagonist) [Kribbella voronezhensis]|uniref:Ser/Thr protein kinase RdoA (MazF antagonist) n=1 Tax=Kribbella voronezhensis TaxID=2512212 RepID=A0A4R7TGM7_9ACTN|nr:phosphotransferase [Kribbella voronezhensis]TDU90658.1 Ser/Thr protein kinase RdoA (MazF antagonist) [Kribbella voronezhensis]
MIKTIRSLVDPSVLRDHLGEVYGVGFRECTLIRSFVNDVYHLASAEQSYVLKLYRAGGRQPGEVRWEADLATHLSNASLAVPRVVPLADGSEVGLLEAAEGARPYLLSTFVLGTKPRPPFTGELYRSFGELIATFHDAADSFRSPHPRLPADLHHNLETPLAEIAPLLAPADRELLERLAIAVQDHFAQHDGPSWGICHGDVTLDNILQNGDGLAIHDFDLSAEGYRATDFAGVAGTEHWSSFVDGYTTRRPIPAADLAAVPYSRVVGSISNLRFHLRDKPLFRGSESINEGWADGELGVLRQAAADLL